MAAVRRGVSEDPPLQEQIVHVLRDADDDAASVEAIRGMLAQEEGVRPATEDVREKARALVDEGRAEVVTETGVDGPRYRLVETEY